MWRRKARRARRRRVHGVCRCDSEPTKFQSWKMKLCIKTSDSDTGLRCRVVYGLVHERRVWMRNLKARLVSPHRCAGRSMAAQDEQNEKISKVVGNGNGAFFCFFSSWLHTMYTVYLTVVSVLDPSSDSERHCFVSALLESWEMGVMMCIYYLRRVAQY